MHRSHLSPLHTWSAILAMAAAATILTPSEALFRIQAGRGHEAEVADALNQRGHGSLYEGGGYFVSHMSADAAADAARNPIIRSVQEIDPASKVSIPPQRDPAAGEGARAAVVVVAHVIGSLEHATHAAEQACKGGMMNYTLQTHRNGHRISVRIPRGQDPSAVVQELSRHPAVAHATHKARFSPTNDWSARVLQAANAAAAPIWDNDGLTGEGQIIAVSDTGVDTSGCFFADSKVDTPWCPSTAVTGRMMDPKLCTDRVHTHRKVAMYRYFDGGNDPELNSDTADTEEGHGTHVAGSAAGSSVYEEPRLWSEPFERAANFNGMAFGARLAIDDISSDGISLTPIPDFLDTGLLQPTHDTTGARIFSMSWGAPIETDTYDAASSQLDSFLHENTDAVALVAAGNDGPDPQTIISPATAKNSIAVGSGWNNLGPERFILSSFSARGPAGADHRIKPDVVCPGEYITSAMSDGSQETNDCAITAKAGTSMATPGCSGVAAILREYFARGQHAPTTANAGLSASGALVKACMIHSGRPMAYMWTKEDGEELTEYDPGNHSPNSFYGWGLILLESIIFRQGDPSPARPTAADYADRITVSSDKTWQRCYAAAEQLEEFRATIAWTDPATSDALVHDLDLTVHLEGSPLFWVGNNATLAGTRAQTHDRTNPAERVVVAKPRAGVYRVTVAAVDITPGEGQLVAAVVTTRGGRGHTQVECPEAAEAAAACPASCSAHGHCTRNGQCECDWPYVGAACNHRLPMLAPNSSTAAVVPPMQLSVHGIEFPHSDSLEWSLSTPQPDSTVRVCEQADAPTGGVPAWGRCEQPGAWTSSAGGTRKMVAVRGGVYGANITLTVHTRVRSGYTASGPSTGKARAREQKMHETDRAHEKKREKNKTSRHVIK